MTYMRVVFIGVLAGLIGEGKPVITAVAGLSLTFLLLNAALGEDA
jgi:hypothetical protein